MAPGDLRPSHRRVVALAVTLLILGPSAGWAHGKTPHEWATTDPASLWAFLPITALLSIWLAGRPHFQTHLRSLRLRIRHAVPWAVIGLLGVHLIVLPPHIVHHLTGPPEEGLQCILLVQGNLSEQERAEPVSPVVAPSLGGAVEMRPAPPGQPHQIPAPSGRSPPRLPI